MRAFRIHEIDRRIVARHDEIGLDDLSPGDVVVRVSHSGINYKDALAATGKGRILRRYPLVGGIDFAGTVEHSDDPRHAPGDLVLVTGCGLSETHDGGYAEFARVPGDWVIAVPAGLTAHDAMALGTAGFTAALAIHRMEQNGLRPGQGPVAVTGATGGVGSLAISMLAGRGYEVVAISGKADADAWLREVGATRVLRRQDIAAPARPLEKAEWAGAIDNLGGPLLGWLLATTVPWGSVASVGLAAGPELVTTVMPFILRGVNLLGINSVLTPRDQRLEVWRRIATDLRPSALERICTKVVDFDELPAQFEDYIEGRVTGRTVVRIQ